MEVMTEVPTTGTRLRIDADRQFEGQPGDSTLRIAGEREGSQVFDATYVECSEHESQLIGWLVRSLRQPTPELLEKVGQEIQATFGARMSGRDAQQAAQVVWAGIRQQAREVSGRGNGQYDHYLEELAERFERASARKKKAFAGAGVGSEGQSPYQQRSTSRN